MFCIFNLPPYFWWKFSKWHWSSPFQISGNATFVEPSFKPAFCNGYCICGPTRVLGFDYTVQEFFKVKLNFSLYYLRLTINFTNRKTVEIKENMFGFFYNRWASANVALWLDQFDSIKQLSTIIALIASSVNKFAVRANTVHKTIGQKSNK